MAGSKRASSFLEKSAILGNSVLKEKCDFLE